MLIRLVAFHARQGKLSAEVKGGRKEGRKHMFTIILWPVREVAVCRDVLTTTVKVTQVLLSLYYSWGGIKSGREWLKATGRIHVRGKI